MKKYLLKLSVAGLAIYAIYCPIDLDAATVTWIGGSGDWTNTAHWSTGALPGTNDTAVIGAGASITVTHSTGTHTVSSIQSQQAFVLSGGALSVSNTFQASNTLTLSGGTLQTATVVTTNGVSLIVSGGTLDGVTVNGTLDVGNSINGANLTVLDGLTLNGTMLAGNPTNSWYGRVTFNNTETLGGSGTVVFGNSGYNWLTPNGTTLTIGPGILVHGQQGNVGYYSGIITNQGTIACDVSGGTITINAQPFSNQGLVEGINDGSVSVNYLQNGSNGTVTFTGGGTLALNGSWNNAGTINATNVTVNLGGSVVLTNLGTFNRSGGTVNLTGTLNNTNGTLTLNAASGSWTLNGGTVTAGTINESGGALLLISSGTLDGVTVNGTLDVGNSINGANLTVLDGLTLNGTMLAGNPTNSWYGRVTFNNTETLGGSGTVVFGNNGYNWLTPNGTTLTIGPGILVHGQQGNVGYYSGIITNQGTIACDVSGGTITINAQPFSNQGLVEGINDGSVSVNYLQNGSNGTVTFTGGGTLALNGSWNNAGTINATNVTVNLGGSVVLTNLGTFNRSGGTVNLTGTLNNTNGTLTLNAASGSWTLNGGTVTAGTINESGGALLLISSGTLDGVTVNGTLDVGNSINGANLTVLDGLTLNGTMLAGNPTNSWYGRVTFNNTETLGGSGTVVFGNSGNNWLTPNGTTLTIGPGILVHGQQGNVGYYSGMMINQGTIACDVSAGTITVNAQPLVNSGTLEAFSGSTLKVSQISSTAGNITAFAGGTVILQSPVFLNGNNVLISQSGGTIEESGSVLGNTMNIGQFSPLGTLILNGSGTAASPQLVEVMGDDYGASSLGFIHNFSYGTINLANNTYVELVNQYQNSSSTAPEALYVDSLVVPTGTTLNMNELHVYARATQIGGTVLNGTVTQIPNSGPIGFGEPSLGYISTAGQLDQWTFFARAGQFYTVLVDPGSDVGVSPYLNYVQASVANSNGVVIVSKTNSTSGAAVLLSSVAITNDGTYSVEVHAPPGFPSSTGHYQVTVWQTTPNVQALTMEQIESGNIQTPYSVDEWTFAAVAGEQIRFGLVNVSSPGVAFDLQGPNGPLGFTNLTTNSSFVTLPTSGNYSINAHSLNGQYGVVYAFEVYQTIETNVTLGTQFDGQWAGTGQAILFQFNVSASAPLQIVLNNLATNNHADVYVGFGQPPTPASANYSSTTPSNPNQSVLIPIAAAGTWYVLVYGDNIETPGGFTVLASSSSVLLSSVTPGLVSSAIPFSVTLNGAGFDASSVVQLLNGANTYPATSISVDSFTQITANEASNTLPAGTYSVRVSLSSGASATLTNCLTVTSNGVANLVLNLVVPASMGYHIPSTIYSGFGNNGNAPMLAPLFILTATGNDGRAGAFLTTQPYLLPTGLWTSANPAGFSHAIQFMAFGTTPGLLQPGESYNVPVYYAGWQQPWGTSPFTWSLSAVEANDSTPTDWLSLETTMQPANIPSDAWAAIWTTFTNQIGPTWGGYVTMLDNDASYLGRLGDNVFDVGQLLTFQLMQADGLCPLNTLASSVDASVPTPGLSLTFSRTYGERISQRYAMGPLGRGWSHNWQYSLQVGSDGTVTIFGPRGSQREFQPNTQNGGYFAEAGDYGTLASAGSGAFTLTEKTGEVHYYAANGTLSYLEDPNGNRITLGYTGGLLTSLTHSSGQSIQLGYNGAGLIQTVTDNFGHQTVLTYDSANQHLTGGQYFDGRSTTYTYNTTGTPGQLHALTGAASSCCNWRYFNYDEYGRLTGTSLANNQEPLTFTYGSSFLFQPLLGIESGGAIPFSGGLCTVTDGLGNATQFYYDHRGLMSKAVDGLGNAVHLSFDNNYNLTSFMDPAGRSYNFGYDSEGNLTQSTDPLGDQNQFAYTSAYNCLASVSDANGNPTHYGYDPYGNLESITYANGSVEDWSYDDYGNPQTWNNRRDHQTFFTFNNNGQLTGKYFADGSATLYTYDSKDNLTNTTTYDIYLNPLTSVGMTYDANNHLTQMNYPGGKYLAFSYDDNGRRISSVDQLGHTLFYTYDEAGRLQSMTNELNNLVVSYQYDPAGNIAVKTLGSGIFATYQYDPAGQLLNLTNALTNGTLLSRFDYSYDNRGRRTAMTTLDGNWTYAYDDLGQLLSAIYVPATTNVPAQNLTYIYDGVGNRTQTIENGVTKSYSANNVNEYFSVGQTNYTFDADGNLVKEVSPQGTTAYTYNDENRLVSMTSSQGTWTNSYDGLGDRIGESDNGTNTQYVVDPIGLGNVVGEYNTADGLVAHYDHALGLVAMVDAMSNNAGYTFDAMGNVQQVVSSEGGVINNYAYSPFGELLRNAVSAPNPFQFSGQLGVVTENSGLNFMRARYYEAGVGRFQTADPVGISGGLNLYCYSLNNSLTLADPSGLDPFQQILDCAEGCTSAEVDVKGLVEDLKSIAKSPGSWSKQLFKRVPLRITRYRGALSKAFKGRLLIAWDSFQFGTDIGTCINECTKLPPGVFPGPLPPNPCPSGNCGPGVTQTNATSTASDPNQITGPAGFGPNGFVVSSNLLAYRINFENASNAAAPAQQVNISDQLSTDYDWTTFNVSEVGFGNLIMSLPPGVAYLATNIPYSYLGSNFQVQIQIGIQPTNGLVYGKFQSIDPTTSLPPPVNIGFLPPENGTGIGMGHVTYTIHAKAGLPNGTQLTNVALISFDEQPQIATDQLNETNAADGINPALECLITLDSIPPTSYVLPLPAQEQLLQFPVSWTGQDYAGGPGIASYNIYVSDNGSAWTNWLSATTNTNAVFQGKPQHAYGFTSQAADNAGLVEAQHTTADATTTVVANPLLLLSVSPAATNLSLGSTLNYSIVVSNLGTLNLDDVTMSNAVPAGLSVELASFGHGSVDIEDTYVDWSLGNLNTNKGYSMILTATIEAPGTWTNLFTVADSQGAAFASASQVIIVPGPPTLTIALTGHQVVLAWPTNAGAYLLQTTTNLAPQASWSVVTNLPSVIGSSDAVTLPITNTTQFFRLQSQ